MNLSEFEKQLRRTRRCQTVGFTAIVTPSRMRKTNNPNAGKVRKISIGHGLINACYDDAVNRQRIREGLPGNFASDEPSVGNRAANCPLVERVCEGDGRTILYLEIWIQRTRSHYFHVDDGRELSYWDDIQPFEYQRPGRTGFAKSQGTRKTIRSCTYRLDSIAELRIGGATWKVEPLVHELDRYIIPAHEVAQDSDDAQQPQPEAVV